MSRKRLQLIVPAGIVGTGIALLQATSGALPPLAAILVLAACSVLVVYGLMVGAGGTAMVAGPWNERIEFSRDGSGHVPGTVAIHVAGDDMQTQVEEAERARDVLQSGLDDRGVDARVGDPEPVITGWFRLQGGFDASLAVTILHDADFEAQVVTTFFSHGVNASPFYGSPFYGSPFHGSPFHGSPFHGSPFYGSPFYGSPFHGSPFYGSPFYGSPFYGSPFYGSATPSPSAFPFFRLDGRRPSTARPETPTGRNAPTNANPGLRVAILDTGWIRDAHQGLAGMSPPTVVDLVSGGPFPPGKLQMPLDGRDIPDGDGDGYLDPVTGHGTFIAGIIERLAPGCELTIWPMLTEFGDGREDDISVVLDHLAHLPDNARPNIVNLSFGGYLVPPPHQKALGGMGLLKQAVMDLQEAGVIVVASAGNDSTWVPAYPAALNGVVSVAALDGGGHPAAFTNYGEWVRACALGVDLVSIFFDGFSITPNEFHHSHPLKFQGWARWSGTSFAAPVVVAALAREMAKNGLDPEAAVQSVVGSEDNPDRLPMLGRVLTTE